LPGIYVSDGRFLSFALVYYFFPLLTTVFMRNKRFRVTAYILFALSFIITMTYMYTHSLTSINDITRSTKPVIDVILPFVVCGLFTTAAVQQTLRHYRYESSVVENSRVEADRMEKSKDIFLMNMSHEIRTPMNAIMSSCELIAARNINSDTMQNVHHIMNACKALISTIDDLLVFSRVENKRIVLAETTYDLKPLLDDIINMISVRLMNSDVRFYVYVDPMLPRELFGDMVRIRQVFINILNNAVKYTKTGHVMLRVKMQDRDTDSVVIHVEVEDTGIGIRQDMLPKLFEDFVRVQDNINESLKNEGSGLGLSITKAIINEFGGDISVESEYNKGSVFSFNIPQRIADPSPIADVDDRDNLGIIIFDTDSECEERLKETLNDMKIRNTSVYNTDQLAEVIDSNDGSYTHIFVSTENSEASKDILRHYREMVGVVLRDVGEADSYFTSDKITKPLSSINIAEFFNEEEDVLINDNLTLQDNVSNNLGSYMVRDARAIVIDDNMTNLIVSDRLLRNLGFDVVTAGNGKDAVSLTTSIKFDIVFIDYMMPEMDGVDTLRAIRRLPEEWTDTVPCLVLTADAHEGAKQMLLNAGFDDYLSKPINITELEYMIRRYIPKEKLTEHD
nr:response regulator [Lachnospiraceae bacterium]